MPMAQTKDENCQALERPAVLEAEHRRLQHLVGELLHANEELCIRLMLLEQRAKDTERGLAAACAPAALLLP
mgnify:CR=1 FL=1